MKPIKKWLEELPEPYRTQAINQQTFEEDTPTMKQAVDNFAKWGETQEGHDYWNRLFRSIPEPLETNHSYKLN